MRGNSNLNYNTMKKLSETLNELGIAFTFPIEIKGEHGNVTYHEDSDGLWGLREYDANGYQTYYEASDGDWCKYEYDGEGNLTYYEDSDGYWKKREYDADGNVTYHEDSEGYWNKREYDAEGSLTYYENSLGCLEGIPRNQSCAGKVIEVDGKKYKLTEI